MTDTFLSARSGNLIMANYEVNPELLKPYLPRDVKLDFYDNKTYVSLVGFMFKKPSIFSIPFLGTFEEIKISISLLFLITYLPLTAQIKFKKIDIFFRATIE